MTTIAKWLIEDINDAVCMSKCCEVPSRWDQRKWACGLLPGMGSKLLVRRIGKGVSMQWDFAWITASASVTWSSWTSWVRFALFVFNRPPWVLFLTVFLYGDTYSFLNSKHRNELYPAWRCFQFSLNFSCCAVVHRHHGYMISQGCSRFMLV